MVTDILLNIRKSTEWIGGVVKCKMELPISKKKEKKKSGVSL